MRDDFTHRTKEKLAHRAGYVCSKPDCAIPTRGAASDEDKTINLGEAAHITAASPGGPRYDATLSPEQRRHHSNGIWLCATHAKLVDSDEASFGVDELRKWKRIAERRSFTNVVTVASPARHPDGVGIQAAADRLIRAAQADLVGFQRSHELPSHAVALNLQMINEKTSQAFDVSGLAAALELFDELAIIAPPGTGKTTTLLQLAACILEKADSAVLFIPLSEWGTIRVSFMELLLRRLAFRDFDVPALERLAQQSTLTLLLDGWNELDELSRQFVATEIKSLQRDFPSIRLVITSRCKEYDLPIAGPIVEVGALTEKQQLEIARAVRGHDGKSLMEHAWRTPGLRELVSIPLYLSVLLKHAKGTSLPTTKEEVLRTFVREHEEDPYKRAMLRRELEDRHQDILTALALEAIREQITSLSDERARTVVGCAQDRLKADHQITQSLNPMKVLDVLVSTHLLVRSGDILSFQHQQFEEWYASLWIEKLMDSALSGDKESQKTLKEEVLNMPVWEEAILFACERMSRADIGGVEVVSAVVLETLGIDPLLSAEIIYRSSPNVWDKVRDDLIWFARKWHSERKVDRAITFMINTGRPEFSEYIWPLISDPDTQVHLAALRAGRRFRTTVLGSDVISRVTPLSEELRAHIASEIAQEGGIDGIELASLLGKEDKSSRVKLAVIESLMFRRADRFVDPILESAPRELLGEVATKWGHEEFANPDLSERVRAAAEKASALEADPRRRLHALIERNVREPDTGQKVRKLIEEMDFGGNDQNDMWMVHRAYERYPEDVANGLVSHLAKGSTIPFQSRDLLRASGIAVDKGPVVEKLLKTSAADRDAGTAAAVAGPKTIGALIDRLSQITADLKAGDASQRKELGEEYYKLMDIVASSKISSFSQAVLDRANAKIPEAIEQLAELIARHGRDANSTRMDLDAETHQRMTAAVHDWARALLGHPEATRAQFARIAQAAERLGSPSLVPVLQQLLAEDLARRHRAQQERLGARQRGGHIQNDAHMSWTLQYRLAFIAIADETSIQIMKSYLPDREFGIEAAHVLKAIWKQSQPSEDDSHVLRSSPDFSEVRAKRRERASGHGSPTFPFVDDILSVVADLIKPGSADEAQRHALQLATVAFSMPYRGKDTVIASLLALPRPAAEKLGLLTALAVAGETLPSELVLNGIDELFEDAKTKPWLLQDQDGWRMTEWLKLLPFTDKPSAVLSVLPRMTPHHAAPWKLRGLLSALGWSPSVEAERVLHEIARNDPRFVAEHDWRAALTRRNTFTAATILLDVLCASDALKPDGRMDFTRELSRLMEEQPQFRKEVYQRYPRLRDGPAKGVLERAIAEVADAEGTLLLVRTIAARGACFHSSPLYTALRHVLVGQRHSLQMSGMHELYSLPASDLRRELFGLVLRGTPAESKLAAQCLTAVDEIRDDFGYLEFEPRHPDIRSGAPWPQLESLATS